MAVTLRDIEQTVDRLVGAASSPRLVILFGSRAQGRERADSDVDWLQLAALNPYAVDMRYEASDGVWVSEDDIRLWTQRMQAWVDRMIDDAGSSRVTSHPGDCDPT